ncbi:surfeit locus 1 family protein [Pseudorhodobacter antarcticus]|jgi:surfeit locus 1 family protein|uniref:SURF1-like protein n=1 Tax=Pseudorhodobacter antarcticus TaxID=1077947 RepID=A0A1H8AUD7_9RHOB|nr:SURF1 family protein [Pseudorhodobacter antarcticus]SEM74362.1 surfeit locus 1 family protein [Pseudorhodobacter antarcticus]
MMRRVILPLMFGLAGVAILVSLGLWQVQRLAWKEQVLAQIDARIAAIPVDLPGVPDPVADQYLPVSVSGELTKDSVDVLVSRKQIGAGYRVVTVLKTDTGRRVLLDRGFLAEAARGLPREVVTLAVTGNLVWPDEVDGYTPAPDAKTGIWFARDVVALAAALKAEPLLVVARSDTGDGIEPLPVDSAAITNDHLNYAITWFLLAIVWAGMTVLLLWRMRRNVA